VGRERKRGRRKKWGDLEERWETDSHGDSRYTRREFFRHTRGSREVKEKQGEKSPRKRRSVREETAKRARQRRRTRSSPNRMMVSYSFRVFEGFWVPEAASQRNIDRRKSIQFRKTANETLFGRLPEYA
jgi:hypothetical protein